MRSNTKKSVYSNFIYKSNKFEPEKSERALALKSTTVPEFFQQNEIDDSNKESTDYDLKNSSTQTSKTILELANLERRNMPSEYINRRNLNIFFNTNTHIQSASSYDNESVKNNIQKNSNEHFFLHNPENGVVVAEENKNCGMIIDRNCRISLSSTSLSNRSNILQRTSPLKHLISIDGNETINDEKISHPNLADEFEEEQSWISGKLEAKSIPLDCDEWSSSCCNFSKTLLTGTKSTNSYMAATISSENKSAQSFVKRLGTLFDSKKKEDSSDANVKFNSKYDEIYHDVKSIPYIDKTNSNSSCTSTNSRTTSIPSIKMRNDFPNRTIKNSVDISSHKKSIRGDESLMKFNNSCDNFIKLSLKKFKSDDWNNAMQGLAEIVEFCKIADIELIQPHMVFINQRLIELLRSPRSHVCKAACKAAGHLFELARDTRRPEFDQLVDLLLCKTADANRFIRQDANLSLDSMVTHISCAHSIRALCSRGPSHKNHLVRIATVRLIVCAVVIAGPENILNPNISELIRKRIFTCLPKFLGDKNIEVRRFGDRLYQVLSSQFRFDLYLKKYLDREEILKMQKEHSFIPR